MAIGYTADATFTTPQGGNSRTEDATFVSMPVVAIATTGAGATLLGTAGGKASRTADATFLAMPTVGVTATGAGGSPGPTSGSRRNAAGTFTGAASTVIVAGEGQARIIVVCGASVTFRARNRRQGTITATGAGAIAFTASGRIAGRLRAIMQPRGESQVFVAAGLRDVTPPVISDLRSFAVNYRVATVSWRTNEDTATDVIEWGSFGPSGPWNTRTITGALGTYHQYTFGTGGTAGTLTPGTQYWFRVRSTDARGNASAFTAVQSWTTDPLPPIHRFYVDWSGDGDFSDSQEEVTAAVLFMEGVTASRGRDQIRQLAPPAACNYSAMLDNRSRIYSPANSQSPLYGLLEPGRLVRWAITYNATTYNLFTGLLDNLPQFPEFGRQKVGTPALGTLSRLRGTRVTTALYQNITTSAALGHLLDAAGWPAGDRVIASGATTLDWWWLDDEDAFSAMVALLSMEGPGAAIYEDGSGRIVFEGRTYRLLQTRCTQVQAVFSDQGANPLRAPELGYEPGLKDVVNSCSVEVEVRAASALGVIWSLGQQISLGNGETKGYTVRPTDPFRNAVTPVSGTDFTVAAGSVASVTMTRTTGATTAIFITAGAGGATVNGLQLRAESIPITNRVVMENDKTDPDTVNSINRRGIRSYPLPLRHELNPEVARDFCNVVAQRYREPRPQVTITVPCVTPETLAACLSRQISDRVAVQDSGTGLSMPVHIEQIRWEWRQGDLYAIFGCEQASSEDYAIWGTAVWDTSLWAF